MAKQKANTDATTSAATDNTPKVQKNRAEGLKIIHTLSISPNRIRLMDKFRGRAAPIDDATVVERADSLRTDGQLQPIQVREIPGSAGEYECIFGNTRKRAADLLVSGYTSRDGRGQPVTYEPAPGYLLRCEVVECDDGEAFRRNVAENHQRSKCSPMDDALNHEELRTTYKMSDAAITKHYGYGHQASVTQLKKLIKLEPEFQQSISNGRMTAAAGFLLSDLPSEQRSAVWLKVVDSTEKNGTGEDSPEGTSENQRIGSSAMAKAIKEFRAEQKAAIEKAAADAAANGGTPPTEGTPTTTPETPAASATGPNAVPSGRVSLTVKGFKEVLTEIGKNDACTDKMQECCNLLIDVITGGDVRTLVQWMLTNIGGTVIQKTPAVSEAAAKANAEAAPVPEGSAA